MEFVEAIAEKTGLPVGIKAAIGKLDEWEELADIMKREGKGPDFITIDGEKEEQELRLQVLPIM